MSKFIDLDTVIDLFAAFGRIMVVGAVVSVLLGIFGLFGLALKRLLDVFGIVPAVAGLMQTLFGFIITYGPYVFVVGVITLLVFSLIYYVERDCTIREAMYRTIVKGEML